MSQINLKKQTVLATTTPPAGYVGMFYNVTLSKFQYIDESAVVSDFNSTVTTVSVTTANGLAGSVANATTTPTITLSTTVTGVLKGNGTAISAATSGTDYSLGTSANTTGIVKSTTGTGALTTAIAGDFPTLNQNTTGTALNITATSNATLTTLSSLSLPGSQVTGTVPAASTVTTNANLTGPVTSVGNVTSVTTNAITNTMLAQMGANTIKGNNTGGSANAADLTVTQTTAMLNVASSSLKGLQAPADKARQDNQALGVFNVRDYGALGNDDGTGTGGQDDTSFIQAAINAAAARKGGIVFFPAGYYKITSSLIVNQSNVEMQGVGGGGYTADIGNFRDVMSSTLVWRGSAGQIMVDVSPTTGASATALKGFKFGGISLDGRDNRGTDTGAVQAGTGLRLRSCHGFHLYDFYIQDCVTVGLDMGVLTAGSIGEAHDCTRGLIERFCIRQLDGTVTPGIGVRLGGSSSANTCCNKFMMGQIMYSGSNTNKPAMQLQNSDSNTFENIFCNRSGSATNNWGIEIFGSSSGATEVSRANIFKNCSPGANGMIACGTAAGKRPDGTLDATYNFTNASRDNFAYPLNTENGEPVPFVGTGSSFDYGITGGSTGVSFPGPGATLAVKLSAAAIANTETQVLGITLPANFMRAGTTFRIKAGGLATNTTAASSSIPRIRIGAGSLAGAVPASITAANGVTARTSIPFDIDALVTVQTAGSAGTIFGWLTLNLHNVIAPIITVPITAAVAVDTTAIRVLELTFISGAATTSYNFIAGSIELLKF